MKNKNIWLLPTDKPSKLFDDGIELYLGELKDRKGHPVTSYNICVTSYKEIKEGDWCLDKFNQIWKLEDKKLIAFDSKGIKRFSTDNILEHECRKIILTTDQSLDGVQEIDDEFLEWFIKNPSCEEVEFENERVILDDVNYNFDVVEYKYKIIIPTEEPKLTPEFQEVIDFNDKIYNQETLEELAEKYSINEFPLKDFEGTQWNNQRENCKGDFLAGAKAGVKWQQEQDKNKYSALETAISLLKQTTEFEVLDSWKQKIRELEQFKKK